MEELIVASSNEGKVEEIRAIFKDMFVVKSMNDVGIKPDFVENGDFYEENARIKARFAFDKLRGKKLVLSDDSGLEVEALGGQPGIFSARYSTEGDDDSNNRKLLKNLKNIKDRKARFVCVMVFIDLEGNEIVSFGQTEGEILTSPDGKGGFGYDPLFLSHDLKKTFGAATAAEKNKVSHRYRALINLQEKINLNSNNAV